MPCQPSKGSICDSFPNGPQNWRCSVWRSIGIVPRDWNHYHGHGQNSSRMADCIIAGSGKHELHPDGVTSHPIFRWQRSWRLLLGYRTYSWGGCNQFKVSGDHSGPQDRSVHPSGPSIQIRPFHSSVLPSFILIMSEAIVSELNLEPIARLVNFAAAGVEPRIMGIGPVKAIQSPKQQGWNRTILNWSNWTKLLRPNPWPLFGNWI